MIKISGIKKVPITRSFFYQDNRDVKYSYAVPLYFMTVKSCT
jgi:hypothetical protein